jgi:hypothetical protein
MATVPLPCDGAGTYKVPKAKDKVGFVLTGSCKFVSFNFVGGDPPGWTPDPKGSDPKKISYNYDGSPIPDAGYKFEYKTTAEVAMGNGTGVIKNP